MFDCTLVVCRCVDLLFGCWVWCCWFGYGRRCLRLRFASFFLCALAGCFVVV